MQDPNFPFAIWLAFKGRRAIGFLCGEIRYRPIGNPHYYCISHWLYIRPEHRGRGVARDLIAVGVEWVQSYDVDTVELMSVYEDTSWKDRGFTPFTTYYFRSVADLIEGRKPTSVKRKEKKS
jgi:GNAT superfamily N-acetyltransferase